MRETGWMRVVLVCAGLVWGALAQDTAAQSVGQDGGLRPPATPLVVHSPYFSIWSDDDVLTAGPTRHWTGHPQELGGLVRVDGKAFRVMGRDPGDVPAMEQVSREVTMTHTRYRFRGAGVEVELAFFTPAFADDLEALSRPVTYVTWTATATDGGSHAVSVMLSAAADIATSYDHQAVLFSRSRTETLESLNVGTQQQGVLNRSGDDLRVDWGYLHLAAPLNENAHGAIAEGADESFAQTGDVAAADVMDGPVAAGYRAPRLAMVVPMGTVGAQAVSRHLLLAYTEQFAMQYMNENLREYWQRNGMTVAAMLDTAERQYGALEMKGVGFDRELSADLTKAAGAKYAWLCTLAYRQSLGAHALVAGPDGRPMMFEKEAFSNGDTATVDVIYPTAPIFLLFNPRLLEANVEPVLRYASMTNRWKWPFAPHDLGQFPLANGQEYGGGERTEEDQMPVEESGNLLILVDAIVRTEKNTALAEQYWPVLTRWAEYLKEHGLDPETQLTTDDFAGHVAHNANLSVKAIDALGAYADLARLLHKESAAKEYGALAKKMAGQWLTMAKEGDHYKLAFTSPGTWSQKYNLVWDKVLDYNLFPDSVRQSEIAFYKTKLNRYGLPLDSRATYTKEDWSIWTATLADRREDFDALVDPVFLWVNETTSRVPMTDWYDTITGKQVGFQARSVVGGLFMKALADKELATKWRGKAMGQ